MGCRWVCMDTGCIAALHTSPFYRVHSNKQETHTHTQEKNHIHNHTYTHTHTRKIHTHIRRKPHIYTHLQPHQAHTKSHEKRTIIQYVSKHHTPPYSTTFHHTVSVPPIANLPTEGPLCPSPMPSYPMQTPHTTHTPLDLV